VSGYLATFLNSTLGLYSLFEISIPSVIPFANTFCIANISKKHTTIKILFTLNERLHYFSFHAVNPLYAGSGTANPRIFPASQTISKTPVHLHTLFHYRVIFLPASVYSRWRPPAR